MSSNKPKVKITEALALITFVFGHTIVSGNKIKTKLIKVKKAI
jgi:hypothetical protein